MNSLNHAELMEAFTQGNRIIGRTRQGQFFPQFEVEVLGVQSDHVTIRSAWGGATNVGADVGWIEYFICNTITPEPKVTFERVGGRTGCWRKVLNPPQPHADPRLSEINTSCTFPKPKPNPKPSRFPQVTHLTSPTLLECRVLTGSWIMAITKRLFGFEQPTDVECSIRNFGHRNSYVTFELHTEHGDDLFIRLRPEVAKALAENINEGEAR